jgi:hypothetical protein
LGEINIVFVPKDWTWVSIFAFRPLRAAITAVTDATPMIIPSVVSTLLVLLAHIWPIARYML